jgi:hypothetical protein
MMVYLLIESSPDGEEILGAYSTQAGAEAMAALRPVYPYVRHLIRAVPLDAPHPAFNMSDMR